ncbi:MAG: hypothetical protein IPO04_11140 [Cytophagaceae bacterium]|nr:hypothetical protein [Cytophagaceae bacterium]
MGEFINFQIKGIEALEFNITEPKVKIESENTFGFELLLEHNIDLEKNSVAVECYIKIGSENNATQFAALKTVCIYEIPDLNSHAISTKDNIKLPDSLVVSLNSVTISTVRGVAFTLFRGTYLHNAILPIIDPSVLTPTSES